MSIIGKNIRKVRVINNLTQSAFASLFDIKRTNISAYEDGRANPKNDLLLKICSHYKISMENFSSKELTVNELSNFNDQLVSKGEKIIKNETSFPFISKKMLKEYQKKNNKVDFRMKLPRFSVPFNLSGSILAFEISEHSLIEIPKKCTLICQELNIKSFEKELNSIFCFALLSNSFELGYFKNEEEYLNFTPNLNEKTIQIAKKNLVEVWKVIGVLNMDFQYPSLHQNIQILSRKIEKLSNQLED